MGDACVRLTTDRQLRLWKFDRTEWLILQATGMIGFRGWLGGRESLELSREKPRKHGPVRAIVKAAALSASM
jgi:hypothetical protein